MKLTKGDIFMLTRGEYSDFRVDGLYQALTDFNLEEKRQSWVKKMVGILGATHFKYSLSRPAFQEFLLEEKLAVACNYVEFHVYNYYKTEGVVDIEEEDIE